MTTSGEIDQRKTKRSNLDPVQREARVAALVLGIGFSLAMSPFFVFFIMAGIQTLSR